LPRVNLFKFLTFYAKIRRLFPSRELALEDSTAGKLGRPPISDRVIRVGGAVGLLPLLRERAIEVDALVAKVGLPVTAFDHPDNVIPFAALGQLVSLAADRTGLADIGLRACMHARLGALGALGYLVANSESVGSGLMCLQTYLHLHDEGAAPYLLLEDGVAILGYEVLEPGLPGADQIAFGALAIGANILREICGAGFALREVTFAFRGPADTSFFRAHFAAPVRFDAVRTALVFDAALLGRPIFGADSILRDVLMAQARETVRVEGGELAKDRIRRVMRTLLATGRFSQDEVASAFGMNRRTLARRLHMSGTTFREVLDGARFDTARGLLQGSGASLADIALKLGYADATAFTRAFRRWSGSSPAAWRRSHAGF
jgi:AraC-like DNA-binding protein